MEPRIVLPTFTYRKVTSSRLSWLVAHPRIFKWLMKGKFDPYVRHSPKVPKLNSRPVYCSRLYGTYLIESSGVSLNKWGCQNPPEPSLVVFGENDSAIISNFASGKAFFNLTAEELPTIPAPTTQNFMLNRYLIRGNNKFLWVGMYEFRSMETKCEWSRIYVFSEIVTYLGT